MSTLWFGTYRDVLYSYLENRIDKTQLGNILIASGFDYELCSEVPEERWEKTFGRYLIVDYSEEAVCGTIRKNTLSQYSKRGLPNLICHHYRNNDLVEIIAENFERAFGTLLAECDREGNLFYENLRQDMLCLAEEDTSVPKKVLDAIRDAAKSCGTGSRRIGSLIFFLAAVYSYAVWQPKAEGEGPEPSRAWPDQSQDRTALQYRTYYQMKESCSALEIAERLVSNDLALYSGVEEFEGTPQLWAEHIVAWPDNWGFLCDRQDRIEGNWSYLPLTREQEELVRRGLFFAQDASVDETQYLFAEKSGGIALCLLNLSLNDGYQTMANWNLLWKTFLQRLLELAGQGIPVTRVYANLVRPDHIGIFQNLGFVCLCQHVAYGTMFCLDLQLSALDNLYALLPELKQHYGGRENTGLTFRQLSREEELSLEQLQQISDLIYSTDAYIYPAMMTREQAQIVLPVVLTEDTDHMFALDNLYCACVGERVIGIILHKKGALRWDPQPLKKTAHLLGERLSPHIDRVAQEYFAGYDRVPDETTSVINCCVDAHWRMGKDRVGTQMLRAFLEQHPEKLELYVLKETPAAIQLYLRAGFRLTDSCNGFSVEKADLPCLKMERPACIHKEPNRLRKT